MQLLPLILLMIMCVPILISLSFMPYLTRKTVSFGVAVSEQNYNSNQLRAMRKQYTTISLVVYTALLLLCIYLTYNSSDANEQLQGVMYTISIVGMVVISIIMNILFHFKMKKLSPSLPSDTKAKSVLAIDTSFRKNKLILSNKWFLIHVFITLVGAIIVLLNYNTIPDSIAMKFDLQGNVIKTSDKSYVTILFPTMMQIFMTLLFLFVNWSIHKSKQQIDKANPERSVSQNTLFRRRWSMFTILSGLAMILLFSFMQLSMISPVSTDITLFISIAIPAFVVLFAVILSFTTGQGGSRIGGSPASTSSSTQPFKDDKYWKLGSLYFNPSDPSIFVEKRVGIGWTVNFAHPAGSLILLGIILICVLLSIFTG